MSRRTSLPGADELFRSTGAMSASPAAPAAPPAPPAHLTPVADPAEASPGANDTAVRTRSTTTRRRARPAVDRRPTGRERHEEKITVYVSADELLDLEHARLTLRGDHGLAVDRGRIVREALAVVLADLDAKGETSILVQRLRGL
jgi:hypothetical protein